MSFSGLQLFSSVQRRTCFVLFQKFSATSSVTWENKTFKYDDLSVHQSAKTQKPDFKNLKFGVTFSDHMLKVEWSEAEGWGKPQILPLHLLQLHPGAKVLHYAQAVFEGMKAFRHSNGKVALFRPDMNMKRFSVTSQRACLPYFDSDELLKCIKKLVSIDRSWVPNKKLSSLYIRPNFVGHEGTLGVSSSKTALLYVVTGPVGPYFEATIEPISLLADPKYVRACPGGVGCFKMASNYAPTLYVQKLAQQQGLDQVLWLLGENHHITEAGAMNVFFVIKTSRGELELITPPLDGTILPGVVRQSVLDLARKWKEFIVSERPLTMAEVISAQKEDRLKEVFVCGTALIVCPVKMIKFDGNDINIPTVEVKEPLWNRFLKAITDIQYGKIESDWSVVVEDELINGEKSSES